MDFKLFSNFSKQRDALTHELKAAERLLDEKKREREWVLDSVPPKKDVIDLYHKDIDKRVGKHKARICKNDLNNGDCRRWARSLVTPILESNGGFVKGDGTAHVNALYAVLAPTLKEYITNFINDLKWPSDVGPSLSKRPSMIKKLDSEIEKIEAEIQKASDLIE